MTCHPDWTNVDCPRCAVMAACLAQVPDKAPDDRLVQSASALASWTLRCGYRGQTQMPSDLMPGVLSPDYDQFRVWCAAQIADRLVAWVRSWPTCKLCVEQQRAGVRASHCNCDSMSHPLDSTPAGRLRPATKIPAKCDLCPDDGVLTVFDASMPAGARVELCRCRRAETDWSALAEIVKWMSVSVPLLKCAQAMVEGEVTDDDLLVAQDRARSEGQPVDSAHDRETAWADDPGLWPALHGWRDRGGQRSPECPADECNSPREVAARPSPTPSEQSQP